MRNRPIPAWLVNLPTVTIIVVYAVYALGMWFQPARWSNTPSYGNLIKLADIHIWGVAYALVAVLLLAYLLLSDRLWYAILAHTAAIALTAAWEVAFFIRWRTDDGTTVVNVGTWGTSLALLVASALLIDIPARPVDDPS